MPMSVLIVRFPVFDSISILSSAVILYLLLELTEYADDVQVCLPLLSNTNEPLLFTTDSVDSVDMI